MSFLEDFIDPQNTDTARQTMALIVRDSNTPPTNIRGFVVGKRFAKALGLADKEVQKSPGGQIFITDPAIIGCLELKCPPEHWFAGRKTVGEQVYPEPMA